MHALFIALFAALRCTVRSRLDLEAEVLALRHQLAVLQRQAQIPSQRYTRWGILIPLIDERPAAPTYVPTHGQGAGASRSTIATGAMPLVSSDRADPTRKLNVQKPEPLP